MSKGKRGVRVAGDCTSYFLPRGLTRQWFDLEHLFETRTKLPITVQCAYDARILPAIKDLDIVDYIKGINEVGSNMLMHIVLRYISQKTRT